MSWYIEWLNWFDLARLSECSHPDLDTGNGFPDPIYLCFDVSHDTFIKKNILQKWIPWSNLCLSEFFTFKMIWNNQHGSCWPPARRSECSKLIWNFKHEFLKPNLCIYVCFDISHDKIDLKWPTCMWLVTHATVRVLESQVWHWKRISWPYLHMFRYNRCQICKNM